jgi:diguanylate cyclase (GGDEF)-like protein
MRRWVRQNLGKVGVAACLGWLFAALLFVPLAWYAVFESRAGDVGGAVALRADSYTSDVRETLSRYDTLPSAIARSADIYGLLQADPIPDAAVLRAVGVGLTQNAVAFRTSRIVIVNRTGLVVATDDWLADRQKLIGNQVGQYALIRDALRGEGHASFALGLASAGLAYIATAPVLVGGQVIGAVVVEASPLETREQWYTGDDTVLVLDDQGFAVLASRGGWRFKQLSLQQDAPQASLEAGDVLVTDQAIKFGETLNGRMSLLAPGEHAGLYAASSRNFEDLWTVLVLRPLDEALAAGRWAAVVVGVLCLAGLAISVAVIQVVRLRALMRDRLPVDPLTGLLMPRAIQDRFVLVQALKNRGLISEVALVVFDVKDLRRINTRFGRAAGDRVLRELGALLRRQTRATDTAFRLGKDDLAVLLPVRDVGGAIVFAERVQGQTAMGQGFAGLPEGIVRIDFGIALCMPGELLAETVERADQHLRRQIRERREALRAAA